MEGVCQYVRSMLCRECSSVWLCLLYAGLTVLTSQRHTYQSVATMRCTSGTNQYLCVFHYTHEWDESHLIKTSSNELFEPQLSNWSLPYINIFIDLFTLRIVSFTSRNCWNVCPFEHRPLQWLQGFEHKELFFSPEIMHYIFYWLLGILTFLHLI